MSTATLSNLRDYLYGTLTPANMIWLGRQLTEYGNKQMMPLKPYSREELLDRAEKGRQEIAMGNYVTAEDLLRELNEDLEDELFSYDMSQEVV